MLKNISFYQQNKERLKKIYRGKYIVIKEQKVLGAFSTWQEACANGLKLLKNDNFLVKYCQ
ncbi:hypothetical protein HUW51_14030 [Adhaeribacter swui]|uniref:DUF5678 domain-containing protein n=1 Tax=Adhaeribacter swui TaxID=2086471 RepID=A0A7G7G9F0_9BACT|nr:hypothetical protein [Adhaeribacter swui]QNF33784.1 hypothetical protein HUW51_14030 [Adhaeribacter swui]